MTDSRPSEPVQILLVEDNLGDVRLIREAFRDVDVETTFHTVQDGETALEFLRERHGNGLELDLTLLDLNLPRKSGFDVLEEIKADSNLCGPPVVVLTSSKATEDVIRSYELCANAYLTKPTTPEEFTELGEAVEAFWFNEMMMTPASA